MACHVTNFQHALQGNVDQANRGVCSVWLNAIVGMRSTAFQMWNDAGTTPEPGGRRLRPPPQTVPLAVLDFVQPVLCELTPRVGEQRAMAKSPRTCRPGAHLAEASPVPAQMWAGWAPVSVQMQQRRALSRLIVSTDRNASEASAHPTRLRRGRRQ